MQSVPNDRLFKGVHSDAKKSYHCCIKLHENGKNTGFFCNDLTSKLHKIKTTEAISKIKKSTGPQGFPL